MQQRKYNLALIWSLYLMNPPLPFCYIINYFFTKMEAICFYLKYQIFFPLDCDIFHIIHIKKCSLYLFNNNSDIL